MTKLKAINRKMLTAFVLSIVVKEAASRSNDKSEKLKHKQYVAEKKPTADEHKEKRMKRENKRLTRRTHHYLCTCVGRLETFLEEPTVMSDAEVIELLTFIFYRKAV